MESEEIADACCLHLMVTIPPAFKLRIILIVYCDYIIRTIITKTTTISGVSDSRTITN